MSASSERIFGRTRPINPLKFDRQRASSEALPPPDSTTKRLAMIAKVKIAQKELGLIDDDYRQILFDEAGVTSAAKASEAGLIRVLERFKSRGWTPKLADGKKAAPRPASHPGAGKARALWISLHQLGAIADSSEAALEAFAKRQLKCERLQWANQSLIFRLIEALKAIAERHGWAQDVAGLRPEARVPTLKRRLILAILAKLKAAGLAPEEWTAEQAAWSLGGIEMQLPIATDGQLDQAAQALGRALRNGGTA